MFKQPTANDLETMQKKRIWSTFISGGRVVTATIRFLINELPGSQRKSMYEKLEQFKNLPVTDEEN